jgi:hypothetical protein
VSSRTARAIQKNPVSKNQKKKKKKKKKPNKKTLDVIPEDLGSIPRPHVTAYNSIQLQL